MHFFRLSLTFWLTIILLDGMAQVPAFPGAVGGGSASVGGRGGRVIEVTNLNDSGPGSFREACLAEGPRIVVFKVGGTIELESEITLYAQHSYLTIAGQTAPGGGILISGRKLPYPDASKDRGNLIEIALGCHDITMRYLKLRLGRNRNTPFGPDEATYQTGDCLHIGWQLGSGDRYNIMIDHCSMSWSQDENIQVSGQISGCSFQKCISSESLAYNHPSGGALVCGGSTKNVSFFECYFASNLYRNPWLKNANGRVVNCLTYNYVDAGTELFDGVTADVEGCLYTPGPSSRDNAPGVRYRVSSQRACYQGGRASLFMGNNLSINRTSNEQDVWDALISDDSYDRRTSRQTFEPFPAVARDPNGLDTYLLADVGASQRLDENGEWVANRDAVDLRLIEEYENGEGLVHPFEEAFDETDFPGGWPTIANGTPYADDDRDGMPNAWEQKYGLNPNDASDQNLDADGDQYHNIEEFLNGTAPKELAEPEPEDSSRYEAEYASSYEGTIDSNHTGYSGIGFVNFTNQVDSYIEWTVSANDTNRYTLDFRFANGSAGGRPCRLLINGAVVDSTIVFETTGGWGTWTNRTIAASLNEGENIIRLVANTEEGGPNLDYVALLEDSAAVRPSAAETVVFDNRHVQLYPNPVTAGASSINISMALDKLPGTVEVTITDMTGKVLFQSAIAAKRHMTIPLSSKLIKGVYTVSLSTSYGKAYQKIMVK